MFDIKLEEVVDQIRDGVWMVETSEGSISKSTSLLLIGVEENGLVNGFEKELMLIPLCE